MHDEMGFLYLNAANAWPTFKLHNLQKATDGSLTLLTAPGSALVGVFRGGPFEALAGPTPWYRLQVDVDRLLDGTHIQLFTWTADSGDATYNPNADNPFADPGWEAAPRDALDILIPNAPAHQLWIGGLVRGDGQATPALRQMRVEYGRDTYLTYLPAIYGEDPVRRDFLERFLSLPGSVLGGLEKVIADLPLLFDAASAPAEGYPSWLDWLAGWLAFDLNEQWSHAQTRQYLAEAFDLYGKRGTVEGLRRYLKIYGGVEARIVEPVLEMALWTLGESALGFTTMLAAGDLQGAVLDTSATLDRAHLGRGNDFGAALFDTVAHRFYVQIYCGELTRPGTLDDVRTVIEREKPAHTAYHLCVIEPRMRVGAQARVGVDAIIAAGPPMAQLGMVLDGVALAQAAQPCDIQEDSR